MLWIKPDNFIEKEVLFFINKILRENDLLLFKDCKESILFNRDGDALNFQILFLNNSLLVLNCIFELDDDFIDIKSFNFKKITDKKDIILFLEGIGNDVLLRKIQSMRNNEDFKW